jgi:C4-dicarboxylate-specific signal transduction histidine kinase
MIKSLVASMALVSLVFAASHSGGVSEEKVKQEVQLRQDAQKQEIESKKSQLDTKQDVKKETEKTTKTKAKEKEEKLKEKSKKDKDEK